MAPPGRRRTLPSPISLVALVLCFFSPSVFGASAVLGIDLGTEYIKAALVKPGIPLEIVLTKDSKRKETSAVAFKASSAGDQAEYDYPERLYGGDALALTARIPGDVYPNLKHILGASSPFGKASTQTYKQRYPALQLQGDVDQGTLGFLGKTFGSAADPISVEELLSMELKGIRQNAESMAGAGTLIRDVVITIPTFYTADERRAIESAAELAGLKVIGLISDGLAVGMNYAVSRTFGNPDQGGEAEHHLVFDMGAGSTTATILKFRSKAVKDVGKFNKTVQEISVLGAGWDRKLGGDALNDLIVDDMIEQFVLSKGAKSLQLEPGMIKKHGRAMAKLNREAEKVRQVLSANTATSAFFEGFYEDIDFRYKLSRTDFESMASAFVYRVGQPIEDALNKAGLTMADLTSVIVHGGAVRTPFVQSNLEALVGDSAKLKSNVNADEAAVFGAAFKAAGLSPSFRVKEIRDKEAATYPVTVHWTSNGKERKQNIFQPTSLTGTVKQMPFKMQGDFEFSISQSVQGPETSDSVTKPIWEVQVTNLTATLDELTTTYGCARGNISTMLSFQLDPSTGLPEVIKGTASCESNIPEKKGGMVDDVKSFLGFGKKEQKSLDGEDDEDVEVEILSEPPSASTSSLGSTTSASSASATKDTKAPVNKIHTINLSIKSQRAGLSRPSPSALTTIKSRLAAFDASDRARVKRSETFNTLEALTYRVRDLLTDTPFTSVSDETQRSAIETLLASTSEWLSVDGAHATYDTIKEKLSSLQNLVDPIKKRQVELTKRPAGIEALQLALNQTQAVMSAIREQIDKAAVAAEDAAKAALESATGFASSSTDAESDAAEATPSSETLPDDLDDFPSSSTSSSKTTTTKPKPTTPASPFTESDYTSLSTLYNTITTWLSSQSAAQALLPAHADPVLSSSDLDRRAKQLGDATDELVRRMMKRPSYSSSSSSSSAKPKTSKSAGKAGKSGSGSAKPTGIRIPTPSVSFSTRSASGGAKPAASPVVDGADAEVEAEPSPAVPGETVARSMVVDQETAAPEPAPVFEAGRDEL